MIRKAAELRARRAALVAESRKILKRAEDDDREPNTEEQSEWDKMQVEIDALAARIERIEKQLEQDATVGDPEDDEERGRRHQIAPERRSGQEDSKRKQERREAFWRVMRGERVPEEELRALNITQPEAGRYLVPDEFEASLIKKLEQENVMRQIVRVMPSMSGDRLIPVEIDTGEATWLDEAGAYTESDIVYGQVKIGAHKLGRIIKVSEELLNDAAFSVEAEVEDAFGRTFGRAEESAFVAGAGGAGRPSGVVGSSLKGAGAAAAAITSDNLLELYHGLRRPYRQSASWLFADATALAIRKLKTADDQYIWQPGLTAGQPDTILSRPVYISDYVPTIGAGKKSVLFGDFSYYRVLDRTGVAMQRLNELYAGTGQVGFRMYKRTDGKLTLAEAVVHLAHA